MLGSNTSANSMTGNPSAPAPSMAMAADDAPPPYDPSKITAILALDPQQRVARLAAMQPEEFQSFIRSLRPVQRVALNAGLTPELKLTVAALESPERVVGEELIASRLTHDIYSNAQLQEVMTDFWLNHFNVYLRKNEVTPYYLVSYERDTIRPRSLGKFEDLLEAVAHSPAMLVYLDNAQSIGPDSLAAQRAGMVLARQPDKKKVREGLNENYARELMELHTLGVNGGYTQADVTEVARVLTGWTIDRPLVGAEFNFNPNRHEPGTKKVLGQKIKDDGEMEGRQLLHMLATRPATAQFLCRKLAVRFVSDDPPQALRRPDGEIPISPVAAIFPQSSARCSARPNSGRRMSIAPRSKRPLSLQYLPCVPATRRSKISCRSTISFARWACPSTERFRRPATTGNRQHGSARAHLSIA